MTDKKIHVFNTGNQYTENGQRIAWRVIDEDTVSMVDVDRGIDYILTVIEPETNAQIVRAYDVARTAPWNQRVYDLHREGLEELRQAARSFKGAK